METIIRLLARQEHKDLYAALRAAEAERDAEKAMRIAAEEALRRVTDQPAIKVRLAPMQVIASWRTQG
jgi:hypothetical protein